MTAPPTTSTSAAATPASPGTPAPAAAPVGSPAPEGPVSVPAGAVSDTTGEGRLGALLGLLAYGLWGLFPLYFHLLAPSGAFEILGHRILWTFGVCLVVLAVRRDFGFVPSLLRSPRLLGGVAAAGVFIAVNWVIYVGAVLSGHVTEAALGYFLNPIVTVALGVVVLRERLRGMQWVALVAGLAGAVYLAVAAGKPPWIALSLAVSFAMYGLLKNRLGTRLSAVHSLAAETAALTPVAVAVLAVLAIRHETTFLASGPAHPVLLAVSGIVTALPLLLFAAAARRLPLVTVGLMQFLTPVMQLVIGVAVLGETMSTARWIGFAVVWLALLILAADSIRSTHRRHRAGNAARRAGGPEPVAERH